MPDPSFWPGRNIAMKVPVHEYERTVSFYREILGFREIEKPEPGSSESSCFEFGDKILWIDRVNGLSQAEIWLEIITPDAGKASEYLELNGCDRRDEIEPLPAGFKGFWISSPSDIIHLITESNNS